MKVSIGSLISVIELRDGLGRPRVWRTAEIIGIEDGKAVVSFYKNAKDEERTIKRVSSRDIEEFTEKDLKIEVNGYFKYMEKWTKHNNGTWKLLEERGQLK